MDYAIFVIQIDQIDREWHTECVDAVGWNYPNPLIRSQSQLSEQTSESGEVRIGHVDIKANERFPRPIEDAVRLPRLFP